MQLFYAFETVTIEMSTILFRINLIRGLLKFREMIHSECHVTSVKLAVGHATKMTTYEVRGAELSLRWELAWLI
jgi:hypothetical protein